MRSRSRRSAAEGDHPLNSPHAEPPHSAESTPVDSGTPRFDPDIAHPARVYNVWLGGNGFGADRLAAQQVARFRPEVIAAARANRAFLARVVRYLAAERGIRQFLDIGPGLPAPGNTHQIAQAVDPRCRVLYVDNDPLVLTQARVLMPGDPPGACACLEADLRDPQAILKQAGKMLDLTRPVAVLLVALLHFIRDDDDPAGIVQALMGALVPGSFVAISHLTADFAPGPVTFAVAAYNRVVPAGITARSQAQVTALLGGLSLVPPGVVPVAEWRPSTPWPQPEAADLYAGLAMAALPRRTRPSGVPGHASRHPGMQSPVSRATAA